ncbi:MAG TPA: YciI family protein [Caulobacteraceae bacterium]|jgi:hypothetical protein|nr:YciI family protein [Caulobacteraceae bacterium]
MALYVLSCIDKADGLELRMATREAHLAYVRERLSLVKAAGPLLDDAGQMAGSMFLMEADDRAAIEAFSAGDPYRTAGLFERVEIRVWRVTVGSLG